MLLRMDLTPGMLLEHFRFIETTDMEALGAQFGKNLNRYDLLNSYRLLAEAEIERLKGDDYCLAQIGMDARIASMYLQGGNYREFKERITECCLRLVQEGFAEQALLLTTYMDAQHRNSP